MTLQATADALKKHAAQFDLENKAVDCCKEMVQNYSAEEPDEARFFLRGTSIDELKIVFVSHRLVFESYRSWPHILSRVVVGRASENHVLGVETFGTYDLETGENGTLLDDWFSWDEMRDQNGKLVEFSRQK